MGYKRGVEFVAFGLHEDVSENVEEVRWHSTTELLAFLFDKDCVAVAQDIVRLRIRRRGASPVDSSVSGGA